MLLLKTPGGSSFIWLLPNSLGKDIPWFQLKIVAIAGFFQFIFCWLYSNPFVFYTIIVIIIRFDTITQ